MIRTIAALAGLVLLASAPAHAAGEWSLSGDESKVAFGSIKKDTVGEVHHFGSLSGSVDGAGKVTVEIDVASVETWIDIRNERMQKMVLDASPKAVLTAQVDTAALEKMRAGDTTTVDVEGTLKLNGKDVSIETSLFVARLTDDKMIAVTDEMIMLQAMEAGIDEGITKLMEVAKLPGITRVSPVTLRLVFTRTGDAKKADAGTTAETAKIAAVSGDPAKGKKVFRKCKACHVADSAKNKVGPTLQGVIGRKIAAVEGFKYSEAFQTSDVVWTPEAMGDFLRKPRTYIKGTKMAFAGLKKDADIDNVIAYLQSEAN